MLKNREQGLADRSRSRKHHTHTHESNREKLAVKCEPRETAEVTLGVGFYRLVKKNALAHFNHSTYWQQRGKSDDDDAHKLTLTLNLCCTLKSAAVGVQSVQ